MIVLGIASTIGAKPHPRTTSVMILQYNTCRRHRRRLIIIISDNVRSPNNNNNNGNNCRGRYYIMCFLYIPTYTYYRPTITFRVFFFLYTIISNNNPLFPELPLICPRKRRYVHAAPLVVTILLLLYIWVPIVAADILYYYYYLYASCRYCL